MNDPKNSPAFPDALIKWYGHNGSVRVAFEPHSDHGCPDALETPLYRRLMTWAKEWTGTAKTPRIILLIGGPGNGKTTLIERLVKQMDLHLHLDGKLVSLLRGQCGASNRLAEADLATFSQCSGHLKDRRLWLVQEATSKSKNGSKPGSAIAAELLEALKNPNITYLCCANRGVLVDAQVECAKNQALARVSQLLERIMAAVSVRSPQPLSCWPLAQEDDVAVWPMDAESLFVSHGGSPSPGKSLFQAAIEPTRWSGCGKCPSSEQCPIRQNIEDLRHGQTLDQLLALLRDAELASGKRFSFRDTRSLVPAILLGPGSVDRSGDDLCDEIRKQTQAADGNDAKRRISALVYLTRHRLHHALFPRMPAFTEEARLSRKIDSNSDLLTKTFVELGRPTAPTRRAAIDEIISGVITEGLDPARCGSGDDIAISGVSRESLESAASQDLKVLLNTTAAKSLWKYEKQLLQHLANCTEGISESNLSPKSQDVITAARRVTAALRRCGLVLLLRTLSIREGLWGNKSQLNNYADVTTKPSALIRIRKMLGDLLNSPVDGRSDFVISLRSAICQPALDPADDVLLMTERVKVNAREQKHSDSHPQSQIVFLEVDSAFSSSESGSRSSTAAPLTFTLYQHIQLLCNGVRPECLPQEIHALIDSLKARIGGRRCRDLSLLSDPDTQLRIGNEGIAIVFDSTGSPQPGSHQ